MIGQFHQKSGDGIVSPMHVMGILFAKGEGIMKAEKIYDVLAPLRHRRSAT